MIYLAGPIDVPVDDGRVWRIEMQEAYPDIEFYNPIDHLDATDGEHPPDSVVARDKEAICNSDGVLVGYSDVKMAGTPMEVMFAYERDIPVALWVRDNINVADLSYWYRHHTFPTPDRDKAITYLERET